MKRERGRERDRERERARETLLTIRIPSIQKEQSVAVSFSSTVKLQFSAAILQAKFTLA